MRKDYEAWLRRNAYGQGTVSTQLYRSGRVEEYYGDLDQHFDVDRLESVLAALVYTTEDARQHRPNPTLIPFVGEVYSNMSSYKAAVRLYLQYRQASSDSPEDVDFAEREPLSRRLSKPPRQSAKSLLIQAEDPVTLQHFSLDGFAALQALIASSRYKSLAQAMASLTLFAHPETVRQTGGKSIFRTIRDPRRPGDYDQHNGRQVMLDDNKSASDAFKWTHGLASRLRDVQFNHIYTASKDVEAYTSLANICVTPAFIAKLTDDSSPTTSAFLKFRAYDLYRWAPSGIDPPNKPDGYDGLDWAPPLPPVLDVKAALEARMLRRQKDRTVLSVSKVGWLFGGT